MDILNLIKGDKDWELAKAKIQKNVKKWDSQTPLLEGLTDTKKQLVKSNMATLLENTAKLCNKQMLAETSAMASGHVAGFANTAFPMIRRIFANIVANELVTIQPMQLPNGLIFYLDFLAGSNKSIQHAFNASVYGGGVVGSQLTGGVDLTNYPETGFYNLNEGYSGPSGSAAVSFTVITSGTIAAGNDALDSYVGYDPDLSGSAVAVVTAVRSSFTQIQGKSYMHLADTTTSSGTLVRRHTVNDPATPANIRMVYSLNTSTSWAVAMQSLTGSTHTYKFRIYDDFQAVGNDALGAVVGDPAWGLEFGGNTGENAEIPQIDIKVTSISVQAQSRKLRARWTPELAQDIDAYHSLNPEVEMVSILAELITNEIDAEILGDLLKSVIELGTGRNKNVRYWDARPGRFVDPITGRLLATADQGDFTGNFAHWYMSLPIQISKVSAQIHRKVLKGGATWLVTGPDVCAILKSTNNWMADPNLTSRDKSSVGTFKAGSLNADWDIYCNPYFPVNLILIGRKGDSSPLEAGYIYAPYIPLQTTATLPDPDTGVLNKIMSTRYAKKLVRQDYFGLLVVKSIDG